MIMPELQRREAREPRGAGGSYQDLAPEDKEDSPAGVHPTPSGHDKIAARMLPCVMRALGRKG